MEKEGEGRRFSIRQKWIDERGRDGTVDIICHSPSFSFQTRSAREMKGGLAGEMREEIEIPDGEDSDHLI